MGIPSYFKRLTESVRGLLSPSVQGKVSCLLVDFNCIVYGCLRSTALPVYTRETEEDWERGLNEEVCKYLVGIWGAVGKPSQVFVAVDGVVPMAKIKQQRMRRFKSIWWAQKEFEMGVRTNGERWDTNAITPGTAYMERLARRLEQLCERRGWTLSSADEPGEGEHKAMNWIRTHSKSIDGTVVVYGLDADLILLAMLNGREHLNVPCVLMREKTEFGKGSTSANNSAPFLFLSVAHLLQSLCPRVEDQGAFLLDYIAVMCLLGNDFLPHGMTLKIRDGGHDELLERMRRIRGEKGFVNYSTKKVNYDVFHKLFSELAIGEEEAFLEAIQKKRMMRPMVPRNETERRMMPIQGLPGQWFVETCFLEGADTLRKDWKEVYTEEGLGGSQKDAVEEYLFGIQWVVDYYLGKEIDRMWYYPWHLPPLWSPLAQASAAQASAAQASAAQASAAQASAAQASAAIQTPLQPQEQLALVLPIDSWHLLRNRDLRKLPIQLPQFWPRRFGFISLGKSWMWECEADIPILSPGRLRSALM